MFVMGVEQRQKSTKITPQQNKQESEKQWTTGGTYPNAQNQKEAN